MRSWRLGDHLSATCATDGDRRDLLAGFARSGIAAGRRLVALLDASDPAFVAAAGAPAAIVRFAASRPDRPTVVRCVRGVRPALRLVGAGRVPSLVLRDQVSGV